MTPSFHDELYGKLVALRRDLDEDLERLGELSAWRREAGSVERLTVDLDRQLERARQAAVITLVGSTGAGKSTLLNALVGAEIAREGLERPTTRAPVVYAPADADLERLLDGLPGEPPEVARYDAEGHGPWTEQVLIDAPDVNSIAVEHRRVVQALADRSDVLLVVLHRQSIVEEAAVTFVDLFAGRRKLIFVLGRADELTEASRDELLERLRELARERWDAPDAPVVALSARRARSQPDTSGWDELCEELRKLVREGVLGGVRRHNALGTALRLQGLAAGVGEAVADDLARLPDEVRDGMHALARRAADEVGLRLRLRHADLASMLWNEAGKRWDGPGGWVLRLGGLSSLGMGAGLMLARRNPLLAAGTAAGSYAAGKLGRVRERRRVASTGDLFPAETDFEAWTTDALGPARRRAARLGGSTTAFGLPDAVEAAARIGPAVEDTWNDLVERDLPRAAEESSIAHLRWPFDLPVYALGAWVVLKAVVGYFDGEYLGVDFLLSTVVVLFAYLFLVRFACRRLLAARARALLADVIERCRGAMVDAGEAVEREVREETGGVERALERTADLESRWRLELVGSAAPPPPASTEASS